MTRGGAVATLLRASFGASAGRATTVAFLLVALLLAWNSALVVAPPWVVGLVFLFGAFLGLGVVLSLLIDATDTTATFLFLSLVNAILATAFLSVVVRFTPGIPFTVPSLVVAFDLAYITALGVLWIRYPEQLSSVPIPTVRRSDISVGTVCVAILVTAGIAARTKAATGDSGLVLLVYLWLFATFLVLFWRRETDTGAQVLFVATAGLVMLCVQALSTNGLYAVDGFETTRFVRAAVYDIDVEVFSRRLYYSLTVSGFLPGVSMLTTWSPFRVVKYLVPAIAATSLVGIYRLTREWLDASSAFAAAFLLSFTHPFVSELVTSYRTSIAVPVLVAFFIVLKMDFDVRRQVTLLGYLGSVLLLHDTVGIFLVGILMATTGVAVLLQLATRRRLDAWQLTWVYALTGIGVTGFLAIAWYMSALRGFVIRAAQLVAGFFGIVVGRDLRTLRTAEATVGNLNESRIELLRQLAIVSEVGLMALGTALLIAGWLWRDRLTAALPWHTGDTFHEVLLVGNAAWFGVLVLQPVLGAPRVFLYASPLMAGLFVFAVRQVDAIPAHLRSRNQVTDDDRDAQATASTILLVVILLFGFLTQTGVVAAAIGGTVSYPGLADASDPELPYVPEQDIPAHEWAITYGPDDRTYHVDKHSYTLFLDDPRIGYSQLDQIQADVGFEKVPAKNGCLFARTNNVRSGQFMAYHGGPGAAILVPFPDTIGTVHDTVYTTGDAARLIC